MDWKLRTCLLSALLLCASVVVARSAVKPLKPTDNKDATNRVTVVEVTAKAPATASKTEDVKARLLADPPTRVKQRSEDAERNKQLKVKQPRTSLPALSHPRIAPLKNVRGANERSLGTSGEGDDSETWTGGAGAIPKFTPQYYMNRTGFAPLPTQTWEEPAQQWVSHGGTRDGGGDRQGGESCASAVEITSLTCDATVLTLTGDTTSSADDHDEDCGETWNGTGGHDVVYYYTATCSGLLFLDLCDSAYDTKMYVYEWNGSAADCASGTRVGCSEDYCGASGFRSYLEINITSGNTYYIVVDAFGKDASYEDYGGAYTLKLTCIADEPGACCGPTFEDGCADGIDYVDCQGLGQFFQGPSVTCASITCPDTPLGPGCEDMVFGPGWGDFDNGGDWGSPAWQWADYGGAFGPWNAIVAEGFWDFPGTIEQITFWGFYIEYDFQLPAWTGGCFKDNNFLITFYADNDGQPDLDIILAGPYEVTTPIAQQGSWGISMDPYPGAPIFYATATLPEPVCLRNGWVSVQSQDDEENLGCQFHWLTTNLANLAVGEDDNMYYVDGDTVEGSGAMELCMESGAPLYGACCVKNGPDDYTCTDDGGGGPGTLSCTECPPDARFEGSTISGRIVCSPGIHQIDPPCGEGACCYNDGTAHNMGDCLTLTEADCTASGGAAWHEGFRCTPGPGAAEGWHCPPLNDTCSNATVMTLTTNGPFFSVFGRSDGATNAGCPEDFYPIVWERFSTEQCMKITVDYCGTEPVFATVFPYLWWDDCTCDSNKTIIASMMSMTARIGECCWDSAPGYDPNVAIVFDYVWADDWAFAMHAGPGNRGPYLLNFTAEACPVEGFDCNGNGTHDWDDTMVFKTSLDCNSNGIPDECVGAFHEFDCNTNGIPDDCEVPPLGTGTDCNSNGIPDECEWDCNTNGIADECEVPPLGTGPDCNSNFIPDECEPDCIGNGTPDDCEVIFNGQPDCNGNYVPDQCDSCGDWSGDGATNLTDYKAFQACFQGPDTPAPSDKGCDCFLDFNEDGYVDLEDYWYFQQCRDNCGVCPAGGIPEGEEICYDGYVDTYNDGCSAEEPANQKFTLLGSNGVPVCGSGGHFESGPGLYGADVDWYKLVLTEDSEISWSMMAEFPFYAFVYVGTPSGGNCPDDAELLNSLMITAYWVGSCYELVLEGCLPEGIYWLEIYAAFPGYDDEGHLMVDHLTPCGSLYWTSVVTEPCEAVLGACCLPDGTCVPDQTDVGCEYVDGVFAGDDSECAGLTCPVNSCCRVDGACSNGVGLRDCSGFGEIWSQFDDCSDRDCSAPVSADCGDEGLFGPAYNWFNNLHPIFISDEMSELSDISSSGFVVYENFWALTGEIKTITWWGHELRWVPTEQQWDLGNLCDKVDDFIIKFYNDDGSGQPDWQSPVRTIEATADSWYADTWDSGWPPIMKYTVELDECVSMISGWISIQSKYDAENWPGGGGSDECVFMWMDHAFGGDLYAFWSFGDIFDPAEDFTDHDFALCLNSGDCYPVEPVPCDMLFDCPEGAVDDDESACYSPNYTDTTNNGCSGSNTGSTETFSELLSNCSTNGVTICGNTGNFTTNGWWGSGPARDRDWHIFEIDERRKVTWTVQVRGRDQYTPGLTTAIWGFPNDDCSVLELYNADWNDEDCTPVTIDAILDPGTYAITVFGKSVVDTNGVTLPEGEYQPCGTGWEGTLTCGAPGPEWVEAPEDVCEDAREIVIPEGGGYWSGLFDTNGYHWEGPGCDAGGEHCSEPCAPFYLFDNDVDGWWKYKATCDGLVTIQTCSYVYPPYGGIGGNGPTDYGNIVAIWKGPDCDNLTQYDNLTGNIYYGCGGGDDGGSLSVGTKCGNPPKAYLRVLVEKDEVYWIQLMTVVGGGVGYGQITVDFSDCTESCESVGSHASDPIIWDE